MPAPSVIFRQNIQHALLLGASVVAGVILVLTRGRLGYDPAVVSGSHRAGR